MAAQVFENVALLYAAVGAAIASVLTYLALRSVSAYSRKVSATALKDLLAHDYYEAISIIVPTHNDGSTIAESVRSLLNLQHPLFEVIVADDDSSDDTIDTLIEAFSLVEVPIAHDEAVTTKPLRRMLRSPTHPALTVIDKQYGGRADALNAALNLARRPLVCVTDADSILDAQALIRTSRAFIEDEAVVALTGIVSPLDAARTPTAAVEAVREARLHLTALAAWGALSATTDLEGFALYRRHALDEIGGWHTGSSDADTDLALRLHRHYRNRQVDHRIVFAADAIAWRPPTATLRGSIAGAFVRARANARVVAKHAAMVGDPRTGRIGLVALPHRILFDVLAPVVDVAVYAMVIASTLTGQANLRFLAGYAGLTAGVTLVRSQLALEAQRTTLGADAARAPGRLAMFAASVVEQVFYRPVLAVASVAGTLSAIAPNRRHPVQPDTNELQPSRSAPTVEARP